MLIQLILIVGLLALAGLGGWFLIRGVGGGRR
jgi:hypothetical protein